MATFSKQGNLSMKYLINKLVIFYKENFSFIPLADTK